MAGYQFTEEGKLLLERISVNMNNASYTNNPASHINLLKPLPSITEINNLINNQNLTFLNQGKLNSNYTLTNFSLMTIEETLLSFEQKGIWVYDSGKLIKGSPFSSLRQAGIAIDSVNSTKGFKVDTGYLFKNRFSFYSKPLKDNLGKQRLSFRLFFFIATYGFLRVLINFLPDATQYFTPLVSTIAIITLIYGSLSTIIQQDTKALIAYSSICHMAVIVLGLFSNTIQGIEGAILLGLAHGFISPGLFIIVGGIIYERTGTRVIPYIRGLATMMPVSTILFFIFTLANTGIPLSANFLGEQLALIGI